LNGGALFFSELSPLVQYEIKAGNVLHLELVRAFAAIGYESYRLVPGLGLLAPFQVPADGYLLNLFACKPDAAERLAARDLLVGPPALPNGDCPTSPQSTAYSWRRALTGLPYGARLADRWERGTGSGCADEADEALVLYAVSRDAARPAAERFGALTASFDRLTRLCEQAPSPARLASLARVAREFGARSVAVGALTQLGRIAEPDRIDMSEPFLAPCSRFDSVHPRERLGDWFRAAA